MHDVRTLRWSVGDEREVRRVWSPDRVAAGPEPPVAAPGLEALSPRERELLTLVARGHTDAQIASQLHISVRTVSSHLDRIRDKTGCRRRADLTRLALSAGLV
jgi:DNA-binding CsgD family transcriptional regulator